MLESAEILHASILIVDDQQANVILLERMLRNAGYDNITSTMEPRAVCGLHEEHRYDLILLDLQMPEMDGFEVMEGLKQIETAGYLPVLVITAQPGHKLRALQAGAKDFVSKPFDLIEVQTRIHNMLEVRLLYQKLGNYNILLEQRVRERTAKLRESEERFKSFTELSSDWYWEQDPKGQFTKVSGPVFEMLGIGADQLVGSTGSNFAGGWNPSERALLDDNIASRRPFVDLVYSRTLADGKKQYLQVSGEPMFDSACRFTGYRGIGMDVSHRMQPDQEQARLRSAVDVLAHGVLLIDRASMRPVDVNDTLCRMSAYARHELLALAPDELGIGDSETLAALFDRLIVGGEAPTQMTALQRKDGAKANVAIEWRASGVPTEWIMIGLVSEMSTA
jgi:PAS domain S-box-containing protein